MSRDTAVTVEQLLKYVIEGNVEKYQEQMRYHPLDARVEPEVCKHHGKLMVRYIFHGRTPLHLAAMLGWHKIMNLILNSPDISAEVVNARDRFGYTPLHLAVRSLPKRRLKSGLKSWVKRALCSCGLGSWPKRALHSSGLKSGRNSTVRLLTDAPSWVLHDRFIAATCNEPDQADHQDVPELHLNSIDEENLQSEGYTPLHVHELHPNCVDEENLEFEGYTPTHVAAFKGNFRIVQVLCQRTTQTATGIHATTSNGNTPLDIAKEENYTDLVEFLESFDVLWMQSEIERSANSVNAILVGAALVVGVTFNCWQQPLLDFPDPTTNSDTEGNKRTERMAMFFICVTLAFAFSVASLVVGTLAIMPSREVARQTVKTEVKQLRSSARMASSFLVGAIMCLLVAFHMGGSLVYTKVVFADLGWFSGFAKHAVEVIPMFFLLFVFLLVFILKRVYSWSLRLPVLVFAILATVIHLLESYGHFEVILIGS